MSWPLVCLGDLCSFENGDRGVNYPSKGSFVEAGIPFINAGNLLNQSINKKSLNFITQKQFDLLSNGKVREGDVLYCLRGSIGKFALVKNITKGAIASSLIIIRPGDDLSLSYFSYFLRSILCEREIKKYENGAAQPNLSAKDLKQFQIPLPPLETQKQIAAVLEKADQLRKDSQQMEQELNSLAQSVFIDMFGDPVSNPKGWPESCLDSVTDRIIDCPHSTPKWTSQGVLCIRTSNLTKGDWDFSEQRYVDIDQHKHRTLRSDVLPGDLILSREGTIGVAAIVPEKVQLCLGQRLVQIRVDTTFLLNTFLLHQLLYQLDPKRLSKVMAGSTVKHLNMKDIRALPVIVPNIDEQEKFAQRIDAIYDLISSNKEQAIQLNENFNALMQKAFKGELNLDKSAA